MQQALRARYPALSTRLYLRADDDAARSATLMETYAGGIDAELEAVIEAAALSALARWRQGQRHLERFDEQVAARD